MRSEVGPAPASRQRGMTIIELMVAMVVLGVVVAAAFSVAFSIMNSYREHRRALAVERSARGAMAVLVEAVRNASPGLPTGDITDLIDCDFTLKAIRVVNSTTAPDAIDLVYATGGTGPETLPPFRSTVTSLRVPFNETSTEIVVEDGSLIQPGDRVLVTDLQKGHLMQVATKTQAGPDWNLGLSASPQALCAPPPFTYPARTTVMRVQKARFEVKTPAGKPSMLFMERGGTLGEEAIAEGVEDLQIAIGVDSNGNGVIEDGPGFGAAGNDNEWVYDNAGDTPALAMGDATRYRAIRLTVIGRSIAENSTFADSRRPAAEDRLAAAAADQFRRRSLSTTVEIRNLKGSP